MTPAVKCLILLAVVALLFVTEMITYNRFRKFCFTKK